MRHITFYGWQVGIQHAAFAQLLRARAEPGCKEAQAVLLRVPDEQPATLRVSAVLAERLLKQAKALFCVEGVC
jgi:hypothetical protein